MAFIEWKESYSVGLHDIDQQHKRLIAIINRLHDTMLAGSARAQVARVVDELVDYTHGHFSYEERLMTSAQYQHVDEHVRKHRAMTGQVASFAEKLHNDKASTPLQLMEFLKGWLTNHILVTDMDYSKTVKEMAVRYGYKSTQRLEPLTLP